VVIIISFGTVDILVLSAWHRILEVGFELYSRQFSNFSFWEIYKILKRYKKNNQVGNKPLVRQLNGNGQKGMLQIDAPPVEKFWLCHWPAL